MTMYAKNLPVPPKFDYPYQEQQRYSGSYVVTQSSTEQKELPAATLAAIAETAKKLESARK